MNIDINELIIPIENALDYADDSYNEVTVKIGEAECWVTKFEDMQIVAPRGTEFNELISGGGWLDVLRDISAWPRYNNKIGWGHWGFMKGAEKLVKHGLRGLLRKNEPIVLVGHSLGGGYAINCAILLSSLGFDVIGLITFGCPKALYSNRAINKFKKYGIEVWQFSNEGDPITDVPAVSGQHINEIMTDREGRGYSVIKNHYMIYYKEAFSYGE